MGYYTHFTLTFAADDPKYIEEVEEYLENNQPATYYTLTKAWQGTWLSGDKWKWYDHDEDMKILSVQFPEVTFILEGEGEEAGDLWRAYYKSGKMKTYEAKIVYDEYDPKELE